MSLKQLNNLDRIIFLKEFTAEIVINSAEDERLKKLIKVEKIKRKYLDEQEKPEVPKFNKSIIFKPELDTYEKSMTPIKYKSTFQKTKLPRKITHQPFHRSKLPAKIEQVFVKPQPHNQNTYFTTSPTQGDVLLKIDPLINDTSVQMIECPGIGKNILVKAKNKINVTRITLNEFEIRNIIDYFSNTAKIPIMAGILKASIGSLLISAVISDHEGLRFIITKQSPYDLIRSFRS